ncbi:hypothetical protein MTP06_58730 [Streptomyces sp. PLM4]|nr:hypothetical protein MTP06_58730 [Streptomyces sp. PLM4]
MAGAGTVSMERAFREESGRTPWAGTAESNALPRPPVGRSGTWSAGPLDSAAWCMC